MIILGLCLFLLFRKRYIETFGSKLASHCWVIPCSHSSWAGSAGASFVGLVGFTTSSCEEGTTGMQIHLFIHDLALNTAPSQLNQPKKDSVFQFTLGSVTFEFLSQRHVLVFFVAATRTGVRVFY
jgi:hypothetical protein